MSLDQSIKSGKDHRKEPIKSKPKSCGNHGSCPHCKGNREHKQKRQSPVDAYTSMFYKSGE